MELPFTVVFEAPSQEELRDVLRMRRTWVAGLILALAIGVVWLLANVSRAEARPPAIPPVSLALTSRPPGAAIWLDGREHGRTPSELSVEPGPHALLLKTPGGLDGQYSLQLPGEGVALDAVLWRRQPSLMRLRPALPGATLVDVRLLDDGQVALSIAVPPGPQLQAWRLEPRTGVLQALLTDVAGSRLAFAADGRFLAYLGGDTGPPAAGTGVDNADRVVWLTPAGDTTPSAGWRAPLEPGERLLDASWSPHAERLLVVSSQAPMGSPPLSRLWFVAADDQRARFALSLPSEVVPGSEVWSFDGQHVAFLAHAGELSALCLLGIDGTFRYLADLDPAWGPPLPYPPVAWSTDGQRLLFVAPHQHPIGAPSGWLQPDPRHALFVADVFEPTPLALGDTNVDFATWREDGQLLGLSRAGPDAPLSLRLLGGGGDQQQLLELPLRLPASYAAAWDPARARLLVATSNASGGVEYWLARLGLEDDV